ncbi:hypothetical protein [Xanthomonas campestris]|uniref:hypothetical protein n=1 Tax=Xanthomonas campestris TaxID=339 RepID=UPI001E5DFE9E|nr:hypothetical protein [Xanthomonas campestris]MCC4605044.1 hypothetical protein [Xanthomonas campestris pv. parthenii]
MAEQYREALTVSGVMQGLTCDRASGHGIEQAVGEALESSPDELRFLLQCRKPVN